MKNYKIIFILGTGHSGSTLIDMILGTSPETFSAGELAFFSHYVTQTPHKKIDKNIGYTCTCGKSVQDCSFWKRVNKKINEPWPIIKNRGSIDTYKIFLNILNPFEKKLSFNTNISSNKKVYDTIYQEAKKTKPRLKYIIDSSKDPRRLYEILKDTSINNKDIYVLYLYRNAESYLNSYKKDIKTISGVQPRNMFITLIEWAAVHVASRRMIRKYKLKHRVITYSSFCNNPLGHVSNLKQFLNIKIYDKNIIKRVNTSHYHNIHGSLSRFYDYDAIREDVSWKNNLSLTEKAISGLFSLPFRLVQKYTEVPYSL